jgi:hypothetical protein
LKFVNTTVGGAPAEGQVVVGPDGAASVISAGASITGTHQQLTGIGSSVALSTLTVPADATHVWLQASGATVRFRIDGTAPTASVGFRLINGGAPTVMPIDPSDGTNWKFIQEAATGVVDVMFLKAA